MADPAFALKTGFAWGIGADMIATIDGYSREDVDAYAMESQRRAAHARDSGWFDKSVVPVKMLQAQRFSSATTSSRPIPQWKAARQGPLFRGARSNGF